MNKVLILGTIVKDIELRYTKSNVAIARFTVALRREVKNKEGKYDSDFINCVSYQKIAETISKYFKKGSRILIEGRIQTGTYENNKGEKVYTTDIAVEKVNFVDKKESVQSQTDAEIIASVVNEEQYQLPF